MPDSPTPDTKGAQPEQLVEEARKHADVVTQTGGHAHESAEYIYALATALSECRERERVLREAVTPFVEWASWTTEVTEAEHWQWTGRTQHERIVDWFGPTDFGLLLLAAQPPSEARDVALVVEEGMIVLVIDGEPDTNFGFGVSLTQIQDRLRTALEVDTRH